jgi:exonuclease VII small subunit
MTEMPYASPLTTFETGIQPEKTTVVKILENGRSALEEVRQLFKPHTYVKQR